MSCLAKNSSTPRHPLRKPPGHNKGRYSPLGRAALLRIRRSARISLTCATCGGHACSARREYVVTRPREEVTTSVLLTRHAPTPDAPPAKPPLPSPSPVKPAAPTSDRSRPSRPAHPRQGHGTMRGPWRAGPACGAGGTGARGTGARGRGRGACSAGTPDLSLRRWWCARGRRRGAAERAWACGRATMRLAVATRAAAAARSSRATTSSSRAMHWPDSLASAPPSCPQLRAPNAARLRLPGDDSARTGTTRAQSTAAGPQRKSSVGIGSRGAARGTATRRGRSACGRGRACAGAGSGTAACRRGPARTEGRRPGSRNAGSTCCTATERGTLGISAAPAFSSANAHSPAIRGRPVYSREPRPPV